MLEQGAGAHDHEPLAGGKREPGELLYRVASRRLNHEVGLGDQLIKAQIGWRAAETREEGKRRSLGATCDPGNRRCDSTVGCGAEQFAPDGPAADDAN